MRGTRVTSTGPACPVIGPELPLTRFFELALRRREQQYRALAELGMLAMSEPNLDVTLNEAATRLREVMQCDFTNVLDQRGSATLVVRAACGWPATVLGEAEVPSRRGFPGTIHARDRRAGGRDPHVIRNPFRPGSVLLSHGVRSGISVLIPGRPAPYGVLQADSREPDRFHEADVAVLQAYANVLSGAIAQNEREQAGSQFASIVSHEMRTPLTSLIGFSRRLVRRLDQKGSIGLDQRDELELIYRESYRLHRTVDLLLALSEVERRDMHFDLEELPVNEMLQQTIGLAEERYPGTHFVLTGPASEPALRTDEVAFGRIVANLIENAAKDSPDGSTICIDVTDDPDALAITVRDACGGTPAEEIKGIFRPSFRGTNAHRAGSGLRVGLYVAQRLAARTGSVISVENLPPDGCAFTLRFDHH